MTQFDKSKFNYHGGYLMYRGDYEGRPVYPDGPNVHPTMVGRGVDLFIARFKHRGSSYHQMGAVHERTLCVVYCRITLRLHYWNTVEVLPC